MSLTEQRIIKQITILPATGGINVQWANQVLKDGVVLSETFERSSYESSNLSSFTDGVIDVNAFLTSFNNRALQDKVDALSAKETAESNLANANAEITTSKVKYEETITQLQSDLKAAQVRITELEAQLAIPTPVIDNRSVSPRQIRQALTRFGIRQQVEAAVAAGNQDTRDWWNYANTFERAHPQVIAMATALGVDDASLDQLWAIAATL